MVSAIFSSLFAGTLFVTT